VFNNYFQSVFTEDTEDDLPIFTDLITDSLGNVNISHIEVYNILKTTNIHKAMGPDNISGIILKELAVELSIPLAIIFNKSLSQGTFPSHFKRANIIPVHKSGDKQLVSNYRPISLLPLFSKVFEKSVSVFIYNHVKHAINPAQHGFMKNRSTQTNLVCYVDFISSIIDKQGQVDSIYTDFSKAFDSVSHRRLLHKIKNYGIHGHMYDWISSYLDGRKQRVVIDNQCSSWASVTSGVPQGSLIGPLLFIIYINDLPSVLKHSKCLLYADDAKIYRHTRDDCHLLQEDLNNVNQWCKDWKLTLNTSKCMVISFTNKRTVNTFDYAIEGSPLARTDKVNDLGVILVSNLSFKTHISSVVNKSFRMLGFIKRTCYSFKDTKPLIALYKSYVRTNLEYCAVIWSPWQKQHCENIERVQRKFVKYLCFKSALPYDRDKYPELCSYFNLPTPEKIIFRFSFSLQVR
jgi:hypothetical protein